MGVSKDSTVSVAQRRVARKVQTVWVSKVEVQVVLFFFSVVIFVVVAYQPVDLIFPEALVLLVSTQSSFDFDG